MAALTATAAESLAHPALRNQISRVPYLPGLDGLRALSVVAVMIWHADHEWLRGGFLGVEVFFVISGYLITLLLLAEKERTGTVRLGQFWLRRARRLLPALFTMMAALSIYMALFNRRPMGNVRGDLLAGTFYVSNWFQIWAGQAYAAAGDFAPLKHLWSLAVEEQFYLIWPLVMVVVLRRRGDRLPRVAAWLVGISLFVTVVTAALFVSGPVVRGALCTPVDSNGFILVGERCINVNEALYLSTFSRSGGLLLGAAFAMVWRPIAIMRGPLRTKGRRVDLVAALGLIGLILFSGSMYLFDDFTQEYNPWLFRGGFFLTGLFSLTAIAAATHRRSWLGRLLGIRPLNWIGTRSYGLYIYHWPIFQIIREPNSPLTASQFAIAMCITVPLTELSYRLVEQPVRLGRLAQWMRGQRPARTLEALRRRRRGFAVCAVFALLAGYATVAVATAPRLCENQVQCDSERGDDAIAAAADATVPPTVTVPPSSVETRPTEPGETTVPSAPSTTLGPVDLLPTYAIGESVMLGAAPQLTAGGLRVNAAVSRQGRNTAEVIALLRLDGQIGRTIVIQTGTNGPVSDETLDLIMSALPAEETPLVIFLTVRAPRGYIADNNTRIRQLPDRYPNVYVVDWEAESQAISGDLARDGYHLRTAHAKQFYANLIFYAIGRPDLVK